MNWRKLNLHLATAVLLLATSTRAASFCNALSISIEPVTSHSSSNDKHFKSALSIKSTAAILNVNARAVTPPLIELTRQIFGEDNVHVTATAEEAAAAARAVICGNYSLVVPMGGDGTLSCWIDRLVDEIMIGANDNYDHSGEHIMSVEEAIKRLPVIGYVPRGTGNGLGHVVGCWQLPGVHEATQDDDDRQRKSNQLRLNLISRGKQRRQDRTKRLLLRLKEVGDLIQNQRTESWSGAIGSFPDTKQKSAQANRNIHAQDNLADKYTIVEMPMMEVIHEEHENGNTCTASSSKVKNNKGDLCFFAGSGFDSLMLHDFQQIKAWSRTSKTLPTFIKDALSSVAGYCVALVTLTLPQTLRYGTHKIHVKVTTDDDETLWVDHRRGDFSELAVAKTNNNSTIIIEETINGNIMRKKRQQHLLYSGSTGILAASTTPYYGGGLRLFPYARLIPNKLQLRLGRISPLVGFFNIPKIFEGSYREKSDSFGCLDFIGDEFDVEVSSPVYEEYLKRRKVKRSWWKRIRGVTTQEEEAAATTNGEDIVETETATSGFPFQHSGESMGIKERFRLRVVKQPVRFVSFLQPRVIVDE